MRTQTSAAAAAATWCFLGAWLPLICTLNCTVPAEEVIAAFGISHAEATALAEAEPAGSNGVSFLPYLVGERTPNWPDSSGAVVGLRPGAGKDEEIGCICCLFKRHC
jgi:xylulokinase